MLFNTNATEQTGFIKSESSLSPFPDCSRSEQNAANLGCKNENKDNKHHRLLFIASYKFAPPLTFVFVSSKYVSIARALWFKYAVYTVMRAVLCGMRQSHQKLPFLNEVHMNSIHSLAVKENNSNGQVLLSSGANLMKT